MGDLSGAGLEAARRAAQVRLDARNTARERNRLGQFATPPALARDIADQARRLWAGRADRVRFLDPCIGTGAFYSALGRAFPPDGVELAAGWELDPAFAATAADLWAESGLQVVEGDFTRQTPDPRFNLILTNPPYVRHHHLAREEKARLQALVAERLQIPVSGLAGLYCHFLLLADPWLEEGGLAAWLLPSEFMDVNYGAAVRTYLTERVQLRQIHRFRPADRQFGDALVTSAVVVFEKTTPPLDHRVRMSLGGPLAEPTTSEWVPLPALRAAPKWSAFPSVGPAFRPLGPTLGEFFAIKRGIATGANSFFILPRREAIGRGIPPEFLRPILPSSRHLPAHRIEADADGYPLLDRPLALIDCPLPEAAIHAAHPEFWSYLAEGKRRGVSQGYLASRRTPWYSQEKRAPAPFLCTYMGRPGASGNPFRFYWNRSAATAANVYLLLYPRGPLQAALTHRPEWYPAILGILREIKADQLIGAGRVYGGGLHKLEPKELSRLSAEPIARLVGPGSTLSPTEIADPGPGGGGGLGGLVR